MPYKSEEECRTTLKNDRKAIKNPAPQCPSGWLRPDASGRMTGWLRQIKKLTIPNSDTHGQINLDVTKRFPLSRTKSNQFRSRKSTRRRCSLRTVFWSAAIRRKEDARPKVDLQRATNVGRLRRRRNRPKQPRLQIMRAAFSYQPKSASAAARRDFTRSVYQNTGASNSDWRSCFAPFTCCSSCL